MKLEQSEVAAAERAAPRLIRAPVELDEPTRKGTWVVIAAYQEQTMVGRVVASVRETFPNVVVVDDGSRDATA
jgi:cellulose synthase/poly-beta-1,6-N-acetylglucosamine synthase-like glycosyltransferase